MLNTSGVTKRSCLKLIHYTPQQTEWQFDQNRFVEYTHIIPRTASVGCLAQRRRTGNSNGGSFSWTAKVSPSSPLLSPPLPSSALHPALSASTPLSPCLSAESTNSPLGWRKESGPAGPNHTAGIYYCACACVCVRAWKILLCHESHDCRISVGQSKNDVAFNSLLHWTPLS